MPRPQRQSYESQQSSAIRCTECGGDITRPVGALLARYTFYDGTPISAVHVMTTILGDLAAYASRVEQLEQAQQPWADTCGGQVDHVS